MSKITAGVNLKKKKSSEFWYQSLSPTQMDFIYWFHSVQVYNLPNPSPWKHTHGCGEINHIHSCCLKKGGGWSDFKRHRLIAFPVLQGPWQRATTASLSSLSFQVSPGSAPVALRPVPPCQERRLTFPWASAWRQRKGARRDNLLITPFGFLPWHVLVFQTDTPKVMLWQLLFISQRWRSVIY